MWSTTSDTNAEQLLADMSELARFANTANLSEQDGGLDAATIDLLIAELGHSQYRRRQLASTKLTMLGPSALAAVERASTSRDAEIRLRATSIRDRIQWMLSEQRVDFVTGELLTRARPQFVYLPNQESRRGHAIDVVRIQIEGERSGFASGLRHLLGPNWNEVRLATVEKSHCILLGSDTELFERAIEDVTNSRPRLGRVQAAASRLSLDIPSTAEFHGSAERLQAWLVGREAGGPNVAAVTSVRLQVAPQRVHFADVRALTPMCERWSRCSRRSAAAETSHRVARDRFGAPIASIVTIMPRRAETPSAGQQGENAIHCRLRKKFLLGTFLLRMAFRRLGKVTSYGAQGCKSQGFTRTGRSRGSGRKGSRRRRCNGSEEKGHPP
ncbi:MAG: hypothetical protein R3C99_27055 [Pirellulaceae bacterium]